MKKFLLIAAALFASASFAQVSGNNLPTTILPAVARTATAVVSADLSNTNWKGGHIVIHVAIPNGVTITPTVQGKDSTSGQYYTIVSGVVPPVTGTTVMKVFPGATVTTGVVSDILPRTWRVSVSASSTSPTTFSIGASLAQ